jgi:hypothetical protein
MSKKKAGGNSPEQWEVEFWRARLPPADLIDPLKHFVSKTKGSGVLLTARVSRNSADDRRGSLGWLFERIADPSKPFPFDREQAITKRDLFRWLDGKAPDYKPSAIEESIIAPAYRERLQRMEVRRQQGNSSPKRRSEKSRGRKSTIQNDLELLSEFEALDISQAEFARRKQITSSNLSHKLSRAREHRERSNS